MKKYEELWSKIRDFIRQITKNSDDYDEKYSKIEFNSDNKLPLNETIEISTMAIAVSAIFHENEKYYPQAFQMNVYVKYKNRVKANLNNFKN